MANIVNVENTTHIMGNTIIKNKDLLNATNKILGYYMNMRKSALLVSAVLANIQQHNDWLVDFGNDKLSAFEDYCYQILGLKPAQAYATASVGREFLNPDGTCKLFEPSSSAYKKTQLQKLLPLGFDEANSLAEKGIISPEMTVKEIGDIVKQCQNAGSDVEDGEIESIEEKTKDEKKSTTKKPKWSLTDEMESVARYTIRVAIDDSGKVGQVIINLSGTEEFIDITTTQVGRYLKKNQAFLENALNNPNSIVGDK